MPDYKLYLGSVAMVIGVVSYVPYFRDIFLGTTKPHAFSWLVWSVITGIAFAAQIVEHGGPGAWVTGFTTVTCLMVFVCALFKGSRVFLLIDWLSLTAAFGALGLWWITKEPTLAVIMLTLVDALGFVPTYRKAFSKPHEETLSLYVLSSLKFGIAIAALEVYTISTWLYPASLVVMNMTFVMMVMARRQKSTKK